MTTTTYVFPWHRTSKQAKSKCVKCGKTITKTFSIEYNHLGPSESDLKYLTDSVTDYESQEHICTKCQKEAVKQPANDITDSLQDDFKELDKLYEEYVAFNKQLYEKEQIVLDRLNSKLKGTICKDKTREYYISGVTTSFINSTPVLINSYSINKKEPWNTTETGYSITGRLGWYNTVSLSSIEFTDEKLSKRKELRNNFVK